MHQRAALFQANLCIKGILRSRTGPVACVKKSTLTTGQANGDSLRNHTEAMSTKGGHTEAVSKKGLYQSLGSHLTLCVC